MAKSENIGFTASPSVSVIIVNWNSGEHLANCLNHLALQSVRPEHIWVVDNASSDGSVAEIKAQDNLSVLAMDINLGFAEGNNCALSLCTTEYVALLNPDAFPEPDWLEKLLAAVVLHPDAAAFGSRQLCANRPELLDGMGDVYHISGLVWRDGHGQQASTVSSTPCEIFSPCAAAALYQREALLEVGGFDKNYFCYVEDVDLGFRLRLAGYKAMVVPDAVVRHVGSATTGGQHSDFSVYHGHRNLVWTYVKNMPGFLFWVFLPFHLLLNVVSLFLFSAKGQAGVIFRAKWDAIRGIPLMWRKRRAIQAGRVATYGGILSIMNKRLFR
ncbi:MAG: glycosyltransferase family 2 protein [Candidatus Polarisedimenticolaceae bacterium]|nr:glycosyltransferase family 2 protein [Candidatus Polarisedimenticolaceae bacterium]